MTSMTGKEFLQALVRPQRDDDVMYVVGVAKAPADKTQSILLGPPSSCGPWTEIPVAVIGNVVHIASLPCSDHKHPLVAVYLKETKDPGAVVLAKLLKAQGSMSGCSGVIPGGSHPGPTLTRAVGSVITVPERPGGAANCLDFPYFACWERDQITGVIPPPPARPTPIIDCILIWIRMCPRL